MEDKSKEFWDNKYWKNVINDNKIDFIKENWMKKYSSYINKVENKNAIDLGCGIGQDTKWLKDEGFNVVSCDFSERALNKLKELIPNSQIMQLDIKEELPFKDNSIGLINANLSLHYFDRETTIKIFDEIYRILTKNGLFIGRINSNKNEDYINENTIELEKNFYYENGRYRRLFDRGFLDILTKQWKVIILNEDITIRIGRKKALWEFVLKK